MTDGVALKPRSGSAGSSGSARRTGLRRRTPAAFDQILQPSPNGERRRLTHQHQRQLVAVAVQLEHLPSGGLRPGQCGDRHRVHPAVRCGSRKGLRLLGRFGRGDPAEVGPAAAADQGRPGCDPGPGRRRPGGAELRPGFDLHPPTGAGVQPLPGLDRRRGLPADRVAGVEPAVRKGGAAAPAGSGPSGSTPYVTSAGRQLAVICGESFNPSSAAQYAAQARSSYARAGLNSWPFVASCEDWTARAADPYRGPWNTRTPGPVLVIGNRFDPAPRTPARSGWPPNWPPGTC